MNQSFNLQTTNLPIIHSISLPSFGRGFLLVALALACFAISPAPKAFGVSPPPDGDYGNGNTAEGFNALFSLSGGFHNTAIGAEALHQNTTGFDNTAIGLDALFFNTTGEENTATGLGALQSNTAGSFNTATGVGALESNTTINGVSGNANTATGYAALAGNTTGSNNTANGVSALDLNSTGSNNTANGVNALQVNNTGSNNTANGVSALELNTTGSNNTANGFQALENNRSGVGNTANGFQALLSSKSGINNTGDGRQALQNNTSGSFNIALGNLAGHNLTTGSNNIEIGNQGVAAEAKTIRIGEQGNQNSTFIAGISGIAVTGTPVVVSANGQLGISGSSARYKEAIKPMDNTSEALLKLKPVTFRYKQELDPDAIPQFGLIAEEVEKVNANLVARDEQGKPYTVRYDAVNAMLLNEFLKEHQKVEKQAATIAELKSSVTNQRAIGLKQDDVIAQQQKQIEALTAGLQKVSEQVALQKPSPRIVRNNQ